MPLSLLVAAIALALLVIAGLLWLRTERARRAQAPPVSEADARAHAMPLTKSVLSVGPSSRDRGGRT